LLVAPGAIACSASDGAGPDALPDGATPTPYTVQTSSAAPGHPAVHMHDGSPATSWSARPQGTLADDIAWVQADLGSRRHITSIELSSPGATAGLANYAVKVSDSPDGPWALAAVGFTQGDASPALAIGIDAGFLRVETTKIGTSAEHQPAQLSELVIHSDPIPDPAAPPAAPCDVRLTPADDHVAVLGEERGNPDGTWRNLCFGAGTYVGSVQLQHARRIRLLAPEGGVTLEATVDTCPLVREAGGYRCGPPPIGPGGLVQLGTLAIHDASEIVIRGLRIINHNVGDLPFGATSSMPVSTAVYLQQATDVWLEEVELVTSGKNALAVDHGSGRVVVNRGSITGAYMLMVARGPTYAYGVGFEQDARVLKYDLDPPNPDLDRHTTFDSHRADMIFDDGRFVLHTGAALLTADHSEVATDPRTRMTVKGHTELTRLDAAASDLWGWVSLATIFHSARFDLQDDYPAERPYAYYTGAPPPDNELCRYGPSGELIECLPPPAVVVGGEDPPGANLLGEAGDFEGDASAWGSYAGASISRDPSTASRGRASLKIIDGGGAYYCALPGCKLPGLTPGQRYTLSLRARADSPGATFTWNLQSGTGDVNCLFGNPVALSTSWQRYSKTCDLDVNRDVLYVYAAAPGTTFWIDDIRLVATP
jgi:hypothetical protein